MLASGKTGEGAYAQIMMLPLDDHYRPTIAKWTWDFLYVAGCLMEKNDKVSFDMTYSYMVIKGLSIYIRSKIL